MSIIQDIRAMILLGCILASCGDDTLPSPEGMKSSSKEPVIVCDMQEPGINITINPEWDGEYYREF